MLLHIDKFLFLKISW